MNEKQIAAVAKILAQWNPLGMAAENVSDLDGYRTEATDIIFGFKMHGHSVIPERVVMEVLNQAFDLSLDAQSCVAPAKEIVAILGMKG